MRKTEGQMKLDALEKDLADVFNRHSIDSLIGMHDFVLASYVVTCVSALKEANRAETSLKEPSQ